MKPVDAHRNPGAHHRPSLPSTRPPAKTPSHRRIFMAMALVAPAFAIPTGTTGAITAPPETRSAILVTATLGTPVGLYGIQDTDSNVGVQQGDGGDSTTPQDSLGADQEDSAEASQEENGAEAGQEVDTDTEVQQDTVGWLENVQKWVTNHREDVSKGLAVVVIVLVALDVISRMLQHGVWNDKWPRWLPHVVLTAGPVAYLRLKEGVTAIELHAAVALVGLGLVLAVEEIRERKERRNADPSEEYAMPGDVVALRNRQEELEVDFKSFMETVRRHVDSVAEARAVDVVSRSSTDSSSDRPSTQ